MTRSSIPPALRRLAVLIAYAALTAAVAWPVVSHVGGRLAGSSSDVYMNQWADWWTRKALTEGLDLYYTDSIFYPTGTSLVFHSFSHVNTAISLLLAPIIGQVAAYNVMILLAYPLAAFAMYLLALELTGSRPAAFLAGLVYAFQPYHIFESAHPIIVSTQWMPLFVLSLMRTLRAGRTRWLGHMLLAALWFVLTALSSWHLMVMLAGLAILFVGYERFLARRTWMPGSLGRLAVLSAVVAAVLIPFVWPMLREQLAGDAVYMAVETQDGIPNDLLSLLIPNRRHPLKVLVADLHESMGMSSRRPGYLGYAALGLGALGVASARRETRFWLLSALVSIVLSLGPQVEWGGRPLHRFRLPWAGPIIALLRNPFRLNVLIFFCLAILVAYGVRRLYGILRLRRRSLAYAGVAGVSAFVLFEYLVVPFPTTEPSYSSFVYELRQEEGSFAIAHSPMGRQPAKYYMYLQTIHGHAILDGHVSRTPYDAYAFIESDPLLAALREGAAPPADLETEEQLAALSARGIRYLLLHRRLPTRGETFSWREWMNALPTPVYADEWLVAYTTDPGGPSADSEHPAHALRFALGDDIGLQGYTLRDGSVEPGDVLNVTLYWECDAPLSGDLHVFVHLLGPGGVLAAQHDGVPVYGTRPVSSWAPGEVIHDNHLLFTEPGLPGGVYILSAGVYDYATMARLPAVGADGGRLENDAVVLQYVELNGP